MIFKTLSTLLQVCRCKCTKYWCIWQYYIGKFPSHLNNEWKNYKPVWDLRGFLPSKWTSCDQNFQTAIYVQWVDVFCQHVLFIQVWTAIWRALKVMVPLSSNFIWWVCDTLTTRSFSMWVFSDAFEIFLKFITWFVCTFAMLFSILLASSNFVFLSIFVATQIIYSLN